MKTDVDFLRTQAMRWLQHCRGREKALPRTELLHHLRLWRPKLDDRGLREIYSELPVCSCPEGLFLPTNSAEVEQFREYITKAWGPVLAHRRCEIVFSFYPRLRPIAEVQGDLF